MQFECIFNRKDKSKVDEVIVAKVIRGFATEGITVTSVEVTHKEHECGFTQTVKFNVDVKE